MGGWGIDPVVAVPWTVEHEASPSWHNVLPLDCHGRWISLKLLWPWASLEWHVVEWTTSGLMVITRVCHSLSLLLLWVRGCSYDWRDRERQTDASRPVEAGGRRSYRRTGSLYWLNWNKWNGVKHVVSICLIQLHELHSSHYHEPILLVLLPPASTDTHLSKQPM